MPETVLLATLTQLKAQLTIDRAVHDTELELYLAAASNVVRKRVVIDASDVPPEATLATLIIADHLWETQRGASAHPGFDEDDITMAQARRGFAIPRRAEQLLSVLPQLSHGSDFAGSMSYVR